ncbi:hypothetical protein [Planomicrobium sp. Y74]|uniref:hypothetical protein n=1 Tax=Planomicrobium sp. Y74 TaxID=2478977 RepID=UPI000EF5516A|nr:hypothetical protein [Planomicrobium sp. Y74]RLQ90781.1 hypothetical protein D9754_08255 [Planomicrobium sp. Y74]
MSQLRGLFMKDWTIIKGYVSVALLLDVIIPLGAAVLFPFESALGLLVYCGTIMALHTLVPIILLSVLFTKEMDHPDIFFHSSASIHKINASKFGVSLFATALSLIWISILTFVFMLFAPDLIEMIDLLSFGAAFAAGILLFSVLVAIVYYFYLTMFYTMKPKIGGFSYIVSFGLFIFGLEMLDRVAATDLYAAATDFWVIQLEKSDFLTSLSYGLMISFGTPPTLQIGQLLISMLFLIILYLLSAFWFDKKVRA